MMSHPGLLVKISGFTEEKIRRLINERETTHLKKLQEWKLVNEKDTVHDITERVLKVGLGEDDWERVTTEFVYVCWFILDIDNPWTEELFVHLSNGDDCLKEKWKDITKGIENPQRFYKGKPYEDEKKLCGTNDCPCMKCTGAIQQLKTLKNQIRGYFCFQAKKPSEGDIEKIREHIRCLQDKTNEFWEKGDEFGGLYKEPKWETAYVFGTDKMKRALRKHLHLFNQWFPKTTGGSQKQQECCIEIHVSGGGHLEKTLSAERIGDEDKKRILDELKKFESKPLSRSEVIRTLSRHSVGILSWQNRCQATVICVGKDIVLTTAHIFHQDKSEVWEHLLLMYCEKMFPQPNDKEEDFKKKLKKMKTKKDQSYCILRQRYLDDPAKWNERKEGLRKSFERFIKTILDETSEDSYSEVILTNVIQPLRSMKEESESVIGQMEEEIEKFENMREEELVNLHREEMKVHIGYTDDVKDHFKENCCRYFVQKVILLDHRLDFALLKVADSTDFKDSHNMHLRQSLVPMGFTSERVSNGHVFVAAHPYGKTLCVESFVKLLADQEKSVFVENFTTQAILQAVYRSNHLILRHVEDAESVFQNIPVCVYMNKYKSVEETGSENILVRQNYKEGEITHPEEKITTLYKKAYYFPKSQQPEIEVPESNQDRRNLGQDGVEKLLIPTQKLQGGERFEWTLEENYFHSQIQRRGHLQIPIPSSIKKKPKKSDDEPTTKSDGKSSTKELSQIHQPYRFIITSEQEQKSFACEIAEDASKLGIKQLDFIAVEESNGPFLLSVVSEVRYIGCKIAAGKLSWEGYSEKLPDTDKGSLKWKNIVGTLPSNLSNVPVCVVRLNKPYLTSEMSLWLQSDSNGNLSLNFHFRKERVKSEEKCMYFCLEKEQLIHMNITDDGRTTETLDISGDEEKVLPIDVKADGKEYACKVKVESNGGTERKTAIKRKQKRDPIRLEKQNSDNLTYKGSILVQKKKKRDEQTNGYMYSYYNLTLEWKCKCDGNSEPVFLKCTANKVSKREWIFEEKSYVVWSTCSLSTNFDLQFQNGEKSRVTFSFSDTSSNYVVVELDLKEKRFVRRMDQSESPTVFGFILYVEYKRLEKLKTADTSNVVQVLVGSSLEDASVKKKILTKDIITSNERKYIKSEDFAHLKLIDMEYGASGGACCFLSNQGQIVLHGMFLGACPSFYYNDEDIRLFFNRTGTCFNEILPSESLIKKYEDFSRNVRLQRVSGRDDTFIFTELKD